MGKQKPNPKSKAYQTFNSLYYAHESFDKQGERKQGRETRYVYHVSGLAQCEQRTPDGSPSPSADGHYQVPFDTVVRRRIPITSDAEMDYAREEARVAVQRFTNEIMAPAPNIVELAVRNVALLHTILVDADDPEGEPVRVMS